MSASKVVAPDNMVFDYEKIYTGRVKWFNNKSGFGFISLINSESEYDLFAHHTSLNVDGEQFRYLVQGEYLEFKVEKITDSTKEHTHQAVQITGISGGKLMCETRNETRNQKIEYKKKTKD